MKLGYVTIAWGKTQNFGMGIVGHPVGITNIKDLYYVTNGPLEVAFREAKAAGYDGVELFDGDLMMYADRPHELGGMLRQANVEFAGVYTGANLIYEDILPEELWKIERVCAEASKLEARNLVIGAGARRSTGTTDRDYNLLAQGLDRVSDVAEKYGMVASYHPHLTTMVESPEELDKVMSRSKVHFCPDTAHIAAGGGDAVAVVRKYLDRIKYAHLKDFEPQAGFLPMGKGVLKLGEIVRMLRASGTCDWLTVELDSYAGPALEAARISRQFIASH